MNDSKFEIGDKFNFKNEKNITIKKIENTVGNSPIVYVFDDKSTCLESNLLLAIDSKIVKVLN